jgi:hypothetical protein
MSLTQHTDLLSKKEMVVHVSSGCYCTRPIMCGTMTRTCQAQQFMVLPWRRQQHNTVSDHMPELWGCAGYRLLNRQA